MLTWLRKNTKNIMIAVAVVFLVSMFYGLGYGGVREIGGGKQSGFIKINGKDVSPKLYASISARVRESFPERLKPSEALFVQNLALSQTIDFSIMLDDAEKNENVSGSDLNQALDDIAKQQKFNNVNDFRQAMEKSGMKWDDFKHILRDDMLVQKMVRKVRDSVSVSPNDLKEIKVRHILVRIKPGKEDEAKSHAEKLLAMIRGGADFGVLAKKYSEDPGSQKNGGELGFISTGMMVQPFEDAAYALKIGEVGGPVKTEFGYHLIKVEDARLRIIKGEPDPEKAILKQKQDKAYGDWFYGLKQKAKIEILDPGMNALDLRFRGKVGEAVAEYQKAIAQTPENAYLHLALGLLYEDSGKLDLAIYEYNQAIQREAGDSSIYLTLGEAYKKNRQNDLAIEQFKKASLIAGDDKKTHEYLSKTFKELKMPALALMELKEIARIDKKETFEKSLKDKVKVKTE